MMSSSNSLNILSDPVNFFRNLFRKICLLFGRILIAYLRRSRAPFSSSFLYQKNAMGQSCEVIDLLKPSDGIRHDENIQNVKGQISLSKHFESKINNLEINLLTHGVSISSDRFLRQCIILIS